MTAVDALLTDPEALARWVENTELSTETVALIEALAAENVLLLKKLKRARHKICVLRLVGGTTKD